MADHISVLHVDDDPQFEELVAEFLQRERAPIEVITEASPADGIAVLTDDGQVVDCIVSDYDMPGTNGIEFLEQVREIDPGLPFILYTGKGSEAVASDAISAGVTDYLQKGSGTSQYAVLANRITNAVEQYRAKRDVEASQKRLSLFFEQSPLGVIEWTDEFRFERLNDAAEQILGYEESDLVGRSWGAIVPESDQEPVEEVVEELLEAKGGYHSVNENVRKDGERIVCEWHNRVVTDDDGAVVAIFSQFQDVTERRERERELERYEAYLQGSTDIITVLDDTGTIKYQSPSVSRILGYEQGALVGRSGFDLIHPDDREQVRTEIEAGLEEAGEYTLTYRIVTKSDDVRWIWERGRLVTDPVTGEKRLEGFITDFTEHKERERELAETNAVLSTLFRTLPIGVIAEDASRNVLAANEGLLELFGVDAAPDDVVGRNCDLLAEELSDLFVDPARFVERIDEIVAEREPTDWEPLQLRDGRTFARSHRTIEFPDGEGHLWMYRDVTDR